MRRRQVPMANRQSQIAAAWWYPKGATVNGRRPTPFQYSIIPPFPGPLITSGGPDGAKQSQFAAGEMSVNSFLKKGLRRKMRIRRPKKKPICLRPAVQNKANLQVESASPAFPGQACFASRDHNQGQHMDTEAPLVGAGAGVQNKANLPKARRMVNAFLERG